MQAKVDERRDDRQVRIALDDDGIARLTRREHREGVEGSGAIGRRPGMIGAECGGHAPLILPQRGRRVELEQRSEVRNTLAVVIGRDAPEIRHHPPEVGGESACVARRVAGHRRALLSISSVAPNTR